MTNWEPGSSSNAGPFLATIALLLLAVAAGCLGVGEEDEALQATNAHGEPMEASKALKTMQEAGYADPYLDVEADGEVREFDLYIAGATMQPHGEEEMFAFGFADGPNEPAEVPGPEIRVQQGDTVRVDLHSDHHTIHWHGIDVPWHSDGVPFLTQDLNFGDEGDEPGVYTYEFEATQAGTYWYHCAVDFPFHKDFGMFGPLIIEPDEPEIPYDRDEVLMFHEMDSQYTAAMEPIFTGEAPSEDRWAENPVDLVESAKTQARTASDQAGRTVESQTGVETWSEGPRPYYPIDSWRYRPTYDTFMLNGKSYPETEPVEIGEGEVLRLRMVNAGQQTRAIHLHGHHMLVTHKDGYPVEQPYWRDVITMSAGQHIDAYVQGTNPGIWNLHDHAGTSGDGSYEANDYAFPGGMRTELVYEGFDPPGELPKPVTDDAGDLAVYAPSYDEARR